LSAETLERVAAAARACTLCATHLPLGPRPTFRLSATARVLIVGQAPGTKVHETGVPWNDASGDRLRSWLALDRDSFYDESRIAIVPMGLCYPGRATSGGDNPPRPECAPAWHARLRAVMPDIHLVLLIGSYAQAHYLRKTRKRTMTETVAAWRDYAPDFIPTPHPSWRTTGWQRRNPWFEAEVVPALRERVGALVGATSSPAPWPAAGAAH
jgi:uracil-DNA glycosylase